MIAPTSAPDPFEPSLPTLALVGGGESLVEGSAREQLERVVLPLYVRHQRWFGAKSRVLQYVRLLDWSILVRGPAPAYFALVEAAFDDGHLDVYAVPMAVAAGSGGDAVARAHPGAVLARVQSTEGEGVLYDATASDLFCQRLLAVVVSGSEQALHKGRLVGIPTSALAALKAPGGAEAVTIERGSVEQSNTTLFFGEHLLLKMFRKLGAGVNPDFEIGRFLTEKAAFSRVPATAGALEYRAPGLPPVTVAILQERVRNLGQGWQWALGILARYFEEVAKRPRLPDRFVDPSASIIDVGALDRPEDAVFSFAEAVRAAEVLGMRTAEMHQALASDPADPEFAPEPLSADDLGRSVERLRADSGRVFRDLADRRATADPSLAGLIDRVLARGPRLVEQAVRLGVGAGPLVKIRCHGDYHLGQVLRQADDFVILDFEGEPSRSLAERSAKQSPLKDVAGMLRSFDYAASTALVAASRGDPTSSGRLESWAGVWRDGISAVFLGSYCRTAATGAPLVPPPERLQALLDFFVLEKLIVELGYELNYRPTWLHIPLLGIARMTRAPLLRQSGASEADSTQSR
jgi:maltose alpha-D-glucosyltransferase/alpha-amylase